MKNPRITKKEKNLIKGALRRVFSRSELRRSILQSAIIKHSDSKRKRVKTWVKCEQCGCPEAISNVDVDHKIPVVPINSSLDKMPFEELVNNIWCDEKNLQILCSQCHDEKSAAEMKLRRAFKKGKK